MTESIYCEKFFVIVFFQIFSNNLQTVSMGSTQNYTTPSLPDGSISFSTYVYVSVTVVILFVIFIFFFIYESKLKICFQSVFKKQEGPSGLENYSAVCYMNSMIQAAASSDVFVKQFEELKFECYQYDSVTAFVNLLHGVNMPGNTSEIRNENTYLMKELIKSIGWSKPSQQDAYDLFSALINSIQNQLMNSGKPNIKMPMKIELVIKFRGLDSLGVTPSRTQYFLGLSVGLCGNYSKKPGESLEYLLNEHFSPTIIDDDPSKTQQMFFYQQAPDVLLIHIQANKWDDKRLEMFKPEYYIMYEETLCLNVSIITEIESDKLKQENVKYKLKSVVRHSGTISGGHYVTYREYKGRWYLVNDEQVTEKEFDKTIVPYIMIYDLIDER